MTTVFLEGHETIFAKHIKNCNLCQKRNTQVVPYAQLHFDSATFPMEFISMDLIGEFSPPSKGGYRYALTVICMLSGYVFCIPLKNQICFRSHTGLYRQRICHVLPAVLQPGDLNF